MLTESKFLEIFRRHQESDLSVKDFCSNEGIAESTYYYWCKKTRDKKAKQDFISLVVKPTQAVSPQRQGQNCLPVHDTRKIEDDLILELVYPNGTKLRIKQEMDLVHLRTLVCLLD